MTRRVHFLSVCALILLHGCSNGTGPTGGALTMTLASPNDDDGAMLLTLSGGPIDSVETTGYKLYSASSRPGSLSLIVTGNLVSGPIARIHIPDTRQASRYIVSIDQVAARAAYTQRDPASYSVSLAP